MKVSRDPCALGDPHFQGGLELTIELTGGMVECLPKDGQFVISSDIDLVPKIAARQRLCAEREFGKSMVIVLVTYQPNAAATSNVSIQAAGTTMKRRWRTCSVCSFTLARC